MNYPINTDKQLILKYTLVLPQMAQRRKDKLFL